MRITKFITKKELRQRIGLTESTFKRYLLIMETKLLEEIPEYNRKSSLLTPKEANFILNHLGVSIEESEAKEHK